MKLEIGEWYLCDDGAIRKAEPLPQGKIQMAVSLDGRLFYSHGGETVGSLAECRAEFKPVKKVNADVVSSLFKEA